MTVVLVEMFAMPCSEVEVECVAVRDEMPRDLRYRCVKTVRESQLVKS